MINPLIVHEGKVYLIEGWSPKMKASKFLMIRPLTKKETAIWRRNFEEFGFETYAQIVTKLEMIQKSSSRKIRKGK